MPTIALLLALAVIGLVNPALQPSHLWERHLVVATWQITAIEGDAVHATLVRGHKGQAAAILRIQAVGDEAQGMLGGWQVGGLIVGLIGEVGRRGDPGKVLFYVRTRSSWQTAQVKPDGSWHWHGALKGGDASTADFGPLWGTWNGHVLQLDRLFADLAAGRCYHPAQVQIRFAEPMPLAKFGPGRVRGLAVRDFNGDGHLDLVCASPDGLKAFSGKGGLSFTDATAEFGLGAQAGWMLDAADADGDGRDDLLVDGRLLRWQDGRFVPDARLPAVGDVYDAGFADVDGDGRPDVLVALRTGGLRLWRNGATAFTDVTAASGVGGVDASPGYVAAGDWDGDGRLDLFHAAKRGTLLQQLAPGQWRKLSFTVQTPLSFAADGEQGTGRTGVAVFAPFWSPDRMDILVATESRFAALSEIGGRIQDATGHGNEFAEGAFRLLGGVAEDLDMDGTVDILGLSCSADQPNVLLVNRNYGSWTRAEKYVHDLLPGAVGTIGALGGTACDLDGDGANDLVLASADGIVRVVGSQALSDRPLQEDVGMRAQAATVARSRVLRIAVTGAARRGAAVRVVDTTGRVVAMRQAGAGRIAGCCGPDAWSLAIREPGEHVVRVRFADGVEVQQRVAWPTARTVAVTVAHP